MTPIESQFLALSLFNRNNLTGWSFTFIKTKRVCGRCWIEEKVIGLSSPIAAVNDSDTVEQIILHEIAHAITGRREHDRAWVEVAKRIGCRTPSAGVKVTEAPGKWRYWCGDCRTTFYRYRRARTELVCGRGHRLRLEMEVMV
jgi:predicted SprT family Zn-dependent metalloprotease